MTSPTFVLLLLMGLSCAIFVIAAYRDSMKLLITAALCLFFAFVALVVVVASTNPKPFSPTPIYVIIVTPEPK